jgi:phenylacetate-CoA ligase
VAYTSLALSLARELLDGGIELAPGPAVVICGGESLSAAHAAVIARGFRCRTVNRYSALEAAFVAQSCPDYPALLHVNSERAILRVVRPDGTTAPPGEEGRLLVTNLDNHVMPFINYDLGDWAVAGRPCPCGRGFPTLDRVEGRLLELIRTPGGRVISPTALCHFLGEDHSVFGRVRDYQAVQTAGDAVTLRVVPAPRFDAEFAAGLRVALQAFLGADVTASVEVVASIPTEPSGKRFIIRGATPVP